MGDHDDALTVVAGWFDMYVDDVHDYAARRVGPDLARDIVGDTFRIALEQFDRFDARRGDERPWLFGIATNLLRRHWRTESRRLRVVGKLMAATVPAIDPLLQSDERLDAASAVDDLVDVLGALDFADREVLVLTVWEEMTSAEVGAVLGIPAGTVRSTPRRTPSPTALRVSP